MGSLSVNIIIISKLIKCVFKQHVPTFSKRKQYSSKIQLNLLITSVSWILDKLIKSTFLCCFTDSGLYIETCYMHTCATALDKLYAYYCIFFNYCLFSKLFLCLVLANFIQLKTVPGYCVLLSNNLLHTS